jgi:EpsI family protein
MSRLIDIGVLAALAAGVIFAFGEPLTAMVHQWGASPMYSYGYIVPLMSAFLLWSRRDEFRRRTLRPARLLAIPVLALSLAMLVLGQLGAIQVAQQVAFIIAIVGVVLFVFGLDYLAVAAPAIAYLLFMVPLWDAFTEPLHWPFQNNSARLGVALMHAIGIPVHREGTFIALPNVLIEVARECSGINYLVAVFALALPLSVLRLHGTWRRVLLMSGAMIIAALANGVRVALIGTLAYYEVGTPLHGPFHILNGLFVSMVGFVALFAGLNVLQDGEPVNVPAKAPPAKTAGDGPALSRLPAFGLAVVFWAVVVLGATPQGRAVVLAHPLESLPPQLGAWTLEPVLPVVNHSGSLAAAAWNGADHALSRRYRNGGGETVTVDVRYFEAQRQGREIVSSTSADLHRKATRVVVVLHDGTTLNANVVEWLDRGEVGLFWYDVDGALESDQYVTKVRSMWNALRSGRSNGAAVMLSTVVAENAVAALESLAAEVQPALSHLWRLDGTAPASGLSGSR